jgi:hypothetical protein
MATLGDFQNQATGFYAGEEEATRINRTNDKNKKKTALDAVDPYYSQLFEDLNQNQGKAQGNLVSSMARRGLTRSGIRTNAESNLGQEYGKMGERLGTEQRTTKSTAQSDFDTSDSLLNNVDLEYQGKVNQLASELFSSWQTQQDTLAATKASSGYNNGADTTGPAYKNEMSARVDYDDILTNTEDALNKYRAAGYKGTLPSRTALMADLLEQFSGYIPDAEIKGYVGQLFDRYGIYNS